eukprot:48170_1
MEQDSNMMLGKCNDLLQEMLFKDKSLVIGYVRQYALHENNINIPTSIINYCILFCDLMYKKIEYTWVDCDVLNPHYPTIYAIFVSKNATIIRLRELVAATHGVTRREVFICDLHKSRIRKQLTHQTVNDISEDDDIFIYRQKRFENINNNQHDYRTFVVNNQHRIRIRQRFEDESIGYPLLITF